MLPPRGWATNDKISCFMEKEKLFFLSKESLKTIPFCHVAIGERRLDMAAGWHLKSSTRMETDREEMRNGRKL